MKVKEGEKEKTGSKHCCLEPDKALCWTAYLSPKINVLYHPTPLSVCASYTNNTKTSFSKLSRWNLYWRSPLNGKINGILSSCWMLVSVKSWNWITSRTLTLDEKKNMIMMVIKRQSIPITNQHLTMLLMPWNVLYINHTEQCALSC